ncbi:MAG: TonB-dependent receptor [Bacteroidales bacterium]|nr:TonB-dependent receptor [Bacteroidales bacterium]
MMKTKSLVLIGVFVFTFPLMGQAQDLTQTIRGRVVDKQTHAPLPGATVVLADSEPTRGTATGTDGWFILREAPVGRVDLNVSYVGYESRREPNLLVTSGKELVVHLELEENVQELQEVVIQAGRKDQPRDEMAKVSARSFTIEETEKYAGSWGDPSRMAQNYAGVVSAGDQRNDIIIRGNPPTGLSWRLEEVNIPNPNHFGALGATGGPVSILNNNLLTNSDFFTGAFPAEYGNALSGVFDLQMRNGNNQNTEYTGQVGFNGFELGVEGPFSDSSRASYLANYRYSTLSVVDKLGLNLGVGAIPEYQDLSFKIHIPTKSGHMSLFGIGGTSHIELGQDGEGGSSAYNTPERYRTTNGSDMGLLGATLMHFFNENTRIENRIALSGHGVSTTIDSLGLGGAKRFYHENNEQWKLGWYSDLTKKFDARNTLEAGVSLENHSISYIDSIYTGWTNQETDREYLLQTNTKKDNLLLIQGYAQYQHRFSNHFSLYGGLHYQHFTFNNTRSLEPRFNMEWKPRANQSLSFGYGYHTQLQPLFLYFVETYIPEGQYLQQGRYIQTNESLGFTKSNQWVLSYNRSFSKNLRVKIETYYQQQHDIPVERRESFFSLANYGASFHQARIDSLTNSGTSRNYGVELTFEKFFSGNYYFLLTASVFDSKYRGSNGILRNTAFNGNYVVNLLGGYELSVGKRGILALNLRFVTAGGKRYTPLDLEKSIENDNPHYIAKKAYKKQYKDYLRLDGRLSFRLNGRNITQEWALDVANLTDHKNVFSKNYNRLENQVVTEYQQRIFPMLLYRILF